MLPRIAALVLPTPRPAAAPEAAEAAEAAAAEKEDEEDHLARARRRFAEEAAY